MSDNSTKGKLKRGYGLGYGEGSLLCDEFDGGMINLELGRCHFPAKYSPSGKGLGQAAFDEMEDNARRLVASWNALRAADLDALERDGVLAEPRVKELIAVMKLTIGDIKGYIAGEWDGNEEGWIAITDMLEHALAAFKEGEG